MRFRLKFTPQADKQLSELEKDPAKKIVYKSVLKCLGYMETNLRHNSLQTHEYKSLSGSTGEKLFESYAQDKTPGAYRVFWYYGPLKSEITIVTITPHP